MCSNNVTVAHLQKSQVLSSDAFPMNKTEFDSVYRILLFFRYALHLLCTLYFGCFIIWRHKCMADIYNTFNSQRKCGRHTFSIFGKKKRRYAALNKYIFDHSGKKKSLRICCCVCIFGYIRKCLCRHLLPFAWMTPNFLTKSINM